jgi:hypothetical protein
MSSGPFAEFGASPATPADTSGGPVPTAYQLAMVAKAHVVANVNGGNHHFITDKNGQITHVESNSGVQSIPNGATVASFAMWNDLTPAQQAKINEGNPIIQYGTSPLTAAQLAWQTATGGKATNVTLIGPNGVVQYGVAY